MKQNTNIILFSLTPIFCIILFISSGELILPFLERTFIAKYLYVLSFPNSIAFNLSIGYLSGIFIYYLSGYIPARSREQEERIITKRLLTQLTHEVDGLYELILKYTTEEVASMEETNKESFKVICQKCGLNTPTNYSIILNYTTIETRPELLREVLTKRWTKILNFLTEIDNASFYIKPKYYDMCLKIKKDPIAVTLPLLMMQSGSKDLGAWSDSFYDFYKKNKKINNLIKE